MEHSAVYEVEFLMGEKQMTINDLYNGIDYIMEFCITMFPATDEQMDGFFQIIQVLPEKPEYLVELVLPNYGYPREFHVAWQDNGYKVILVFPKDEDESSNPLLFAGEALSFEEVHEIIWGICKEEKEAEDIPLIGDAFHDVTDLVYGRKMSMTSMNLLRFYAYENCSDGQMAHMETVENQIPINIFIDNADEYPDLSKDFYYVALSGIGHNITIYASEEECIASGSNWAPISMIPCGTFPANGDYESFVPSPTMFFSGRVESVNWIQGEEEDEANCVVVIQTLDIRFTLYLHTDEPVDEGYYIQGQAWLFGNIMEARPGE